MIGILEFLGFGRMASSRQEVKEIRISKLSDVINLITNLQSHRLYGAKYLDFSDFCKVIEMMKNKEHLTTKGQIQIKDIVKGMNQTLHFSPPIIHPHPSPLTLTPPHPSPLLPKGVLLTPPRIQRGRQLSPYPKYDMRQHPLPSSPPSPSGVKG